MGGVNISQSPKDQVIKDSESNISFKTNLGTQVGATNPYDSDSLSSKVIKTVETTSI
jgi:hypothetical protein